MNFFGHAVIARWHSASPKLHFGAMLPDFASMIGAAPPHVHSVEVARGVRIHHSTDEVFHRTPTFRRLSRAATRHLERRGLRRGSSLAVGHVGTELLVDCALGQDHAACDDYLAAVRVAAPDRWRDDLEWAASDEQLRFQRLLEVLLERGLGVTNAAPERLAQRLDRVLASRPRLALQTSDILVVEAWARGALGVVAGAIPALLGELRAGLERVVRATPGEEAVQ